VSETILLLPEVTLASPDATLKFAEGVAIRDDRIVDIGKIEDLRRRWSDARVEALPGCLLMAGMVNAHQHGRGISQIQLGYHDDFLEAWISSRNRDRARALRPHLVAHYQETTRLITGERQGSGA
jgi:5-methylthioadenosine/S-adenosylhomocysteine deaminase